jgi:molecular chaperone GrpE
MDIEEIKKQAEEYLNGWKRAKADLVNLQNDIARERAEWAKFAASRTLERLLPCIDTLDAAAAHAPELADVARKFSDCLKNEGVTEIPVEGKYDHAVHEVIGREKRERVEPDTIIIVAQKGYMLHDRVLRPAKVIIAE